jgi:hypothetical protein
MTAPADPVEGGTLRTLLAWFALIGGLYVLFQSGGTADRTGPSGDINARPGGSIDYAVTGPDWLLGVAPFIAAGGALLVAAALLWAARRPATLAAATALLAAGALLGLTAESARDDFGRISRSEALSVPIDMPETELLDRFGDPAGHGTWTRRRVERDCLVYQDAEGDGIRDVEPLYVYCVDDGRVVLRQVAL